MMEMLKYLKLAVLVVCIAAFASGCGGGGGGGGMGTTDPTTPAPTDAERISDAQDTIAGIVTTANNLAQTASSAAAAVQASEDATADQIASALAHASDAQAALADVLAASDAVNAATTPAQAESAVSVAQAALNAVRTAQSAVAAIQSAVNAVAEARRQREADEIALTNGSRLIQHVRDNKILSDALLEDLVADRLTVGPAGATTRNADDTESCVAPCATYAADTGTGASRVVGQRTVVVQGLTSDSTTPLLTGTGILPHGFDPNNGATFVNAYTDIAKTRINVRTRANVLNDDPGTPGDERFTEEDVADTDYLIAGIWLSVGANIDDSTINAFAAGSQPVINAPPSFCVGIENNGQAAPVGATTTTRTCAATTGFDLINVFVDDGQDITATYRGDANGAYIAGGDTSYFTADVELTAEFRNPTGAGDGAGSIEGEVSNITAGGQSIEGSIELQKQTLGNNISGATAFNNGTAVGVVDGKSYGGTWKGQFFGHRVTRSQTTVTDSADPTDIQTTITTTYSPEAPGSVAGTFYATQQSNPSGSTAFIGAFGAHR